MASERRVLIIDDDNSTQRLLAMVLRRSGFVPSVASSAPEAMTFLQGEEPFHLIILDFMGVGSSEVMEFLESLSSCPPVVLCSGATTHQLQEFGTSVVSAIVRKPFDVKQLAATVATLTLM